MASIPGSSVGWMPPSTGSSSRASLKMRPIEMASSSPAAEAPAPAGKAMASGTDIGYAGVVVKVGLVVVVAVVKRWPLRPPPSTRVRMPMCPPPWLPSLAAPAVPHCPR